MTCKAIQQYKQDVDEISAVLQTYVEGGCAGDPRIMKQAFRKNAVIHGYIGGKLLAGPIILLYEWVVANPPAKELESEIINIDVANTVATARVECTNWHGNTFTDQFTLLKEDNSWIITSKVFHTH